MSTSPLPTTTDDMRPSKENQYGTLEVEMTDADTTVEKSSCLYKNRPVAKGWLIFHIIALILSIALFIVCFVIPVTGAFYLYDLILFAMSLDAIITIFACRNGVCCKSKNAKLNTVDDILMIASTVSWILSLCIAILCAMSDTASKYTAWNRWEEFLPILLAVLIVILLSFKLLPRISSNTLPLIYSTNYPAYHQNIVDNASMPLTASYILLPCKWICFLFFMVLSFTLFIHSAQKSAFINTFEERNTAMLTTANYGEFEYQCLGSTEPRNADIRVIAIGGLSTIHLSFGWYNNLIYTEYGINGSLNISICDYNRGGFGFTPSKQRGDKSIESEVNHLMEIADEIFGANSSFHLMGHSRAGVILLMAKMRHLQRVSSLIIFDGVSNANTIRYEAVDPDRKQWASDSAGYWIWYHIYGVVMPLTPTQISTSFAVQFSGASSKENMYEPELSGKYYSLRYYLYQSVVWEAKDMSEGYRNTMKLYNEGNYTYSLDPVLNVECDEGYAEEIVYSAANQTLYVRASHGACVLDKDIANLIFSYADHGVKAFYDGIFLS